MRSTVDRMWTEIDVLLNLNAQLVESVANLWVVVRHGRDNPIVMEDEEEVEMLAESLGNGSGEGLLVDIVDGYEESPEV